MGGRKGEKRLITKEKYQKETRQQKEKKQQTGKGKQTKAGQKALCPDPTAAER